MKLTILGSGASAGVPLIGCDCNVCLSDHPKNTRRRVSLLVEAKDRQEVEAVLAIAEGLRLVPASAEGFATKLGLNHYPILLSKEGWEQ